MGFSSFVIRIEPNPGVFFSGQLITGNVHAAVNSPTSCRSVKVTCEGKAKVHWSESRGDNSEDYNASEEYVKLSFNLWNGPGDKIQPGNYVWPFQFSLPTNIPSSFEGTKGWVRYFIKAKADIAFGFDEKCKVYFSVLDTEDLNYNEIAKSPISIKKSDTSCFWCCTKGPVQLNFNCPRSGAVVGEGFKIRGEISNEGSKQVESTEISLKQEVTYHVRKHTKKDSSDVAKIQRGGIEPGESEFYEDVPLNIEAVVPSLRHCSIMDLEYVITFKASFGSCGSVFQCAILYIGTVPFIPEGMGLAVSYLCSYHYSCVVTTIPLNFYYVEPKLGHAVRFALFSYQLPVQHGPYVTPGYPTMEPPQYSPHDFNSQNGAMDSKGEGMTQSPPPADMKADFPSPVMPTPGYPDDNAGAPYASSFQSPMGPNGLITPPPGVQYPPNQPNNDNLYGLRGAPSIKSCFFCNKDRRRLNHKSPPPNYLSYAGILADAS